MTVAIAVFIGIAIVVGTIWSIRFIAAGPPPEPDLSDVHEVDIPYVCTVCGMSLTITQSYGDDVAPPRHCREDMVEA
ncbi:MAG: hypothetical protein M3094_00325 [Actinomycetia bacterium]|nr:hypothetical protein [Actinomycetes bacterium]